MSIDRASGARGQLDAGDGIALLGAALVLGLVAIGVGYFAFGFDPLAHPDLSVPCLFHSLTGLACPGCGMTRAFIHLSQLDWRTALQFNPLIVLVLSFAILSLFERWRITDGRLPPRKESQHGFTINHLASPALALVLVHWAYALLGPGK